HVVVHEHAALDARVTAMAVKDHRLPTRLRALSVGREMDDGRFDEHRRKAVGFARRLLHEHFRNRSDGACQQRAHGFVPRDDVAVHRREHVELLAGGDDQLPGEPGKELGEGLQVKTTPGRIGVLVRLGQDPGKAVGLAPGDLDDPGNLSGGAVGKDTVSRVWRKVKTDWDAWNAKDPQAQATDALRADQATLERLESLDAGERERLPLQLFGMDTDTTAFRPLRLSPRWVTP
ncbi:hypothetical protein B4Q13_18790, partial [Lacticaseibacillus rhamnosus]